MAFFIRKIGIDLGTANTLVYVPGKGILLNEPSVVAVSLPENKVLAVGNEAKVMIGRTPESIVLRYFISKTVGQWNLVKPEVLISVPAGVTSTERRSVVEAAVKAGAKSAYVVKEPVLAAIGAGIPIHEPKGHMVVDIGGGTTDAAVISLGGIVSAISVKVAGNKLDQAISEYIKRQFNLAIGDSTAEEIKINIGSAIPMEEELTMTIKGRDFLTGLPRSIDIRTNEIVKAIDGELREMVKAIKQVLHHTPPELAADIIESGITMSGGGSLLRNLNILVTRSTGVPASVAKEAIFCVARGTGIALEHLETYKKSIIAKR